MTKIRYLEARVGESDSPSAIVHIRRLSPLDVSFPAPGIYEGQVWIVLPTLDPTHITRFMSTRGVEPLVLIVENDQPIGAGDILRFIEKNIRAIASQNKRFSKLVHHSPINDLLLTSYPTKSKGAQANRSELRNVGYEGKRDEENVGRTGNDL